MEQIAYEHAGTALTGRLARPEGATRAAIVVFPTIANATEAVLRRARMLASEGYLAFVADFYGEPISEPTHSRRMAEALWADRPFYRARLGAALDAVRAMPEARGLPLAAVGFCMGGGAVLEVARDGQDIAAAISFHGLLETSAPAQPGAITARLLVLHGDADPMVPRSHVLAFWEEMDRAQADWHFHSYANVRHGFTDPASDERDLEAVAYDASADRQSWAAALAFLEETLAG